MSTASVRTAEPLLARLSPAAGRTRAEWITDIVFFAIAVSGTVVGGIPANNPQIAPWWWPWDWALGALACALTWWTRRYPLLVGALMIVPGTVAATSAVPVLFSVYRMGLLGRIAPAIVLTVAHVFTALPYHAVVPVPGMPWVVWVTVIPLLYTLCLCIGLLGRARRQVIVGMREEAARDRERYEERLAGARREERERIAREMHDVLAHRISLLSVHAGALEYRTHSSAPPTASEIRTAAAVIRDSASGAVEDLRELLGLLRSDDALGVAARQPLLVDLPQLIDDATAAGQAVELDTDIRPAALRPGTQRTAFRVVQEALTNARKHAPGARVAVSLRQEHDRLRVLVTNAVSPGMTVWDLPPAGNGLTGLEERVRIEGGAFDATVRDGAFRLAAELPTGARP